MTNKSFSVLDLLRVRDCEQSAPAESVSFPSVRTMRIEIEQQSFLVSSGREQDFRNKTDEIISHSSFNLKRGTL